MLKRKLRALVTTPLIVLVALYLLLEEFLENVVKPMVERISAWHLLKRTEQFLQRRNPYILFALYSIKFAVFSGIKFFSLYLMSQGKVYGAPLLVTGELCGAALTVWYAKVALPSLLTLGWFATGYGKAIAAKNWLLDRLRGMAAFRYAKQLIRRVRERLTAVKSSFRLWLASSSDEVRGPVFLRAALRLLRRRRV